jgi:hypothetical protein
VVTNPAPPFSVIVPNGSIWNYFNTNAAPSPQGTTNWFEPGYDASAWLSGRGELGAGDANRSQDANNPETTQMDIGPGASRYLGVYFRHEFVVPNPAQYANLVVRLLRDDGAVVYLNGKAVYTNNMNAGPFTYATAALNSVNDDGTLYFTGNIAPTNLVAGQNVLAVEMHQDNATSSDLSFDLMLWGAFAPPLIVLAPTGGNYPLGITTNLTVSATGALPLSYLWQKDGLDLTNNPTATTSNLVLATLQPQDAGSYRVFISNPSGVTVSNDPPALVVVGLYIPASSVSLSNAAGQSSLVFSLPTVDGLHYEVVFKTNLADATWLTYTNLTGNGGLMPVSIPIDPAKTNAFYRIRLN